ncbi:hypothetical protein LSH36_119g08021 [Paralvinella palmiformis]|jgi:hypothetical protein|uniref:Phytanoyl-CoA hydroxylase-interacting protein-like C-terminal domain-containing protein n=1 Tax=Paralvinella palmiformis TaxID=53620 RepID=A0AAD9NBM6_9ANNE|nr:hypothetical protein LSH36_119g08021 [Paralvinella palmiformis]
MAAFSQDQLSDLREKAIRYIEEREGIMIPCRKLFRDKTEKYYADILKSTGIMETYEKDLHGDQRSPANVEKLKGLFFGIIANKRDRTSIYGPKRFSFDVTNLIDANTRLYFTDFYCVPGKNHPRPHYVSLVITRKGSEADRFCRIHLLSLIMDDNRFFKVLDIERNVAEVIQCDNLHVELYHTEDVNVADMLQNKKASLGRVEMKRGMTGKRQPKLKSPECAYCNLD